jgi:hypothetical protein
VRGVRQAVADAILGVLGREVPCSCIPAYKDRGMTDPQCTYCDVLGSEQDMADAVLTIPEIAGVIERAAKLAEHLPTVNRLMDHWCECPLPPDGCGVCREFFHAWTVLASIDPGSGQ